MHWDDNAEMGYRCKTKKDHTKNEDIWTEANIEPMTTFLRQKTTAMVWSRVKEGKWGYTTKKMITV